jgi:hypothetical protein
MKGEVRMKRAAWILSWLTLLLGSTAQARAGSITLTSDGSTLAAGLGPGYNASMYSTLNNGNTSGLTFTPALVGGYGTFTSPPPGSPAGTEVINIPPGDGESGFFEIQFTLPGSYSSVQLSGAGNVDDEGRVFVNGNPISPALGTAGQLTEYGNATFSTSNASFFHPGTNVLLLADANTGGGPSGAAFYAAVTYNSPTPEPASLTLLGLGAWGLLGYRWRKRKQAGAIS